MDPLCSRLDLRVVELTCLQLGGPVPVERHIEIAKGIQDGHAVALAEVNLYRSAMPDTPEDMIAFMLALHGKIFSRSQLSFAGRIRQEGDPPVRFGTGKNERDGAPPTRIVPELHDLYREVIACADLPAIVDASKLARRCAMFLEHFFRIHPFHDGNGRVARLMVRMMANKTRRFVIEAIPDDKSSRDQYVTALEYAHST